MPGNYSKQKQVEDLQNTTFKDLENPWTFHALFLQNTHLIIAWLRNNNLLLKNFECPKCDRNCNSCVRTRNIDGQTFRCPLARHEYSIRKYSFFERSHFNFADIFQFIKCFLDGLTLRKSATFSGRDYKGTAVDWANFVRDLFQQWVVDSYRNIVFDGDVEIDEILFGRKAKYHRGNRNVGVKVWIFGLVEWDSNHLLLFPVDQRDANTLIPIIQRHVAPGAHVFSDNWAAYSTLNELGYTHFSVTHRVGFKKVYQNVQTGEHIEVHTNRIEGAWKHAKQHFRKLNGTSLTNFEAHLAEIVWRNFHHHDLYSSFFNLVTRYYNLQGPPNLNFPKPLFETWSAGVQHHPDATTVLRRDSSEETSDNGGQTDQGQAALSSSDNPPARNSSPNIPQADSSSDDSSLPDQGVCVPTASSTPWIPPTLPAKVTTRNPTHPPPKKKKHEKLHSYCDRLVLGVLGRWTGAPTRTLISSTEECTKIEHSSHEKGQGKVIKEGKRKERLSQFPS